MSAADETLRARLAPFFSSDGRTFALPAGSDLGSPALDRVIADYLPGAGTPAVPTLTVTGCSEPEGEDPVVFSGAAALARGQAGSFAVTVTFATVAGAVEAGIATDPLPATWGWPESFPSLTALEGLAFAGAAFTLASSSDASVGGHPTGLAFAGTVALTGPLEPFAWLYAAPPRIAGAIALAGEQPLLSIAGSEGTHVSLGPLTLAPGVRLESVVPPGDAATPITAAYAFADLAIGSGAGATTVTVQTPLVLAEALLLTLSLGRSTAISGYDQLDSLTGGRTQFAPAVAALPGSTTLSLVGLDLVIAADEEGVELVTIAAEVALAPDVPWSLLPRDVLTVRGLAAQFTVRLPMSDPQVSAVALARFGLGVGDDETADYDVAVMLPELVVSGALAPYSTLPLDRLISWLVTPFLGDVDVPELDIYQLDLGADVRNGSYSVAAGIESSWTVLDLGERLKVELIGIDVVLSYEQAALTLMMSATWVFQFAPGDDGALELETSAWKVPERDGWSLALVQSPGTALDLVYVVAHFIGDGIELPRDLPSSLKVHDLALTLETDSKDYTVAGAATWTLDVGAGLTLEVEASVDIASTTDRAVFLLGTADDAQPVALVPYAIVEPARNGAPARSTSGTIGGAVRIWELEAAVTYQFGSGGDVLTFTIRLGSATITATRTVERREVILRGGLRGVSFGDVLGWLVNLVDPEEGYRLPAPWDALYSITFDQLTLVANLTRRTFGFRYEIGLELGFASLTAIGLTYGTNAAGQTSVFIALEGSFLQQRFDSSDPLGWDLLNEQPPPPSGGGDTLVDLRYLGIGQNVGFRDGRSFTSVMDVIDALASDFDPPASGDANPLAAGSAPGLVFTGDGRWLIGADLTVMGAVSLAGVFADPVLYGLRIGLSGEKVKSLAGLQFEIFYKKVTDTIGVYQLELTLPSAFRQLQFGAVSVTFPIVGVEIYTNGNFRLDFGFPANRDFSRSFSVQAGPFVGFGGFYLAVLDGATSRQVPQISNGSFSPVIEFGVGLSVGVGRTIDKGVLKAGATLTLETIVEGVVAWFEPDQRALPSEVFYRVEGTAAIVGKLFGSVDFVIVKASVSITLSAAVTLVIEAYRPIEVGLTLRVEVEVSVKVLFFTIDFSFSTSIDLSFEIGSGSTPPWQLAAPAPHGALTLRQQLGTHRIEPVAPARLLGALARTAGGLTVDPLPVPVFDERQTVGLSLVPSFTVAAADALLARRDAAPGAPGAPGAPVPQLIVALFADTGEEQAGSGPRRARPAPGAAALDAPFTLLARGLLRWTLSWLDNAASETTLKALPPRAGSRVGVEQLDAVGAWLADPANVSAAFSWRSLDAFLGENYHLVVTSPPLGATAAQASERGVAAFPMLPPLTMTPEGEDPVRFWERARISPDYAQRLADYYAQTQIDPAAGTGAEPAAAEGPRGLAQELDDAEAGVSAAPPATGPSLATAVFSDWFAMLGKGVVQAARDLYDAYPYRASGSESLAEVLAQFEPDTLAHETGAGETLATVAARYGLGAGELRRANPQLTAAHPGEALAAGEVLAVPVGPSLAGIAEANAGYPLNWPAAPLLPLDGVRHQIVSPTGAQPVRTESLAQVVQTFAPFGVTGPQGLFGDDAAGAANAASAALLAPGASMAVPGSTYQVTPGDLLGGNPLDRVAARAWVRTGGSMTGAYGPWYRQRIADLNSGLTGPVPPSMTGVTVPLAAVGPSGIAELGQTTYAPVTGDTLDLVASYFELIQIEGSTNPGFRGLRGAIGYTPPIVAGSPLAIPGLLTIVRPGESLEAVAERVGGSAAGLAVANGARPGLLAAGAVLALPILRYRVVKGDTLGSVAGRFDLTLAGLAAGASGATGVLAPYGATGIAEGGPVGAMTVPHVASRDRDLLEADLLAFHRFGDLSGSLSRFLLHGLRIPDPSGEADPAEVWPLYETLGQQLDVPPPGPSGSTWDVGFDVHGDVPWVRLVDDGPLLQGMALRLSPGFIAAHAPGTRLDAEIVAGPSSLPFSHEQAPRHTLQQTVHWQAAAPPWLPGPTFGRAVAGQPSIWPLPSSLTQAIATATGPTGPYEVVATQTARPQAGEQLLGTWMWATIVPLRIRRVPRGDGWTPGGYELLGADEAGRELLLRAWRWLRANGSPGDQIGLLYPPAPTDANPQGLISGALDGQRTFLVKASLSTVTHATVAGTRDRGGSAGPDSAPVTAPADFLELVWEASVTGQGGFSLSYADAGGALPDALFGDGVEATIQLLLLTGMQRDGAADRRPMLPFNNCLVLGDNVDAASTTVFARLAHPAPAQLERVPALPAGTAGFRLARTDPGTGATGDALTRTLYNLLGYRVAEGADVHASNEALPAGPVTPQPGDDWPGGATGLLHHQGLVPLARFGRVNDAPASAALPAPAVNPYAGITGPTGPGGRPLSSATLTFSFNDVYGNTIDATPPPAPLKVPLGYADALIAPGAWPGAGLAYELRPGSGPAGGVELAVELTHHADRYVAGGGTAFAQASAAARDDAARYERIHFQLQQHDVAAALRSNIGAATLDRDQLKADALAFVTTAKLLADAAAALRQRTVRPEQGRSLGAVADAAAVTPAQLLAVNQELAAASVFAADLVVPRFAAATASTTLTMLAAQASSSPWPPTCPLGPGDADGTPTAADVAVRNLATPLGPGTTLRTLPLSGQTPVDWARPPAGVVNSIASVAAWLACPVYAAVPDALNPGGPPVELGLVPGCLAVEALIAPGLSITLGAITVVTDEQTTLASLHAAFAAELPGLSAFAAAIADVRGIFRPAAPLAFAGTVVPQPAGVGVGAPAPTFTLADLPAACGTPAQLGAFNALVPGFFAGGASVYLDYTCLTPPRDRTVASLAADQRVTLGQLAAFNRPIPLAATDLLVPDLAFLPQGTVRWSTTEPAADQSLKWVAAMYGSDPSTIAALNRELPGTLHAGSSLRVGGRAYTAAPLDSLATVYARVRADDPTVTWEAFLGQVAGLIGVWRLLIAPLPQSPGGRSLRALTRDYVTGGGDGDPATIATLLAVNRSLEGFLRDGAAVAAPDGTQLAVGACDTVDTVIRRFADEHGIATTIEALAAANADVPTLVGTVPFLLPPPPIEVVSPFDPALPPDGSAGEERVIFPVDVSFELARSAALVTPELAGVPEVVAASTPLSPLGVTDDAGGAGVRSFAARFEAAFADRPLKCALSTTAGSGRIWAVDFSSAGIGGVAVSASDPSFFAMAPLSTALTSGDVPYWPYVSGCGLRSPQTKRFESVDVDAWLRSFLGAVDRFLTTPTVVSAYQQGMDGAGTDSAGRPLPPDGPGGLAWGDPQARVALGATGCMGCTGATGLPFGPDDVDRVIEAKQRIASALAKRVAPILDGVGGPQSLATAQETLRQQLLTRLSSAYEVDAVLDFPVAVSSPWTRGLTGAAPRLSGSVAPVLVRVGGDGLTTLAAVAAAAGVSTAWLTAVVADRPGLLAIGQVATYGSATATVGAADTIATISAALGVTVDFSDPADWNRWSDFTEAAFGLGSEPLVHADTGFPVSAIERAVGPADTLDEVAAFAGADVAAIGRANQDLRGLFAVGARLVVDGRSHDVTAGETIRGIARGMGVTVDALVGAVGVRDTPALLAPGTLAYADLLPDATFSTAKVALGPQAALPPELSVLMTLGTPPQQRNAFFALDYVVNEIEHGIADVPGTGGYQASSWLTFPLPLGTSAGVTVNVATSVPQVQVPLPLRSYPEMPALTAQQGTATDPEATTIADAKRWDYAFDLQLRAAAQDAMRVEVTFESAQTRMLGTTGAAPLLPPLATWAEAAQALDDDLAALSRLPAGGQSTRAAIAAQVLSCLATWIADALERTAALLSSGEERPTYRYRMETRAALGDLRTLLLTREATGPTGAAAPGGPLPREWPEVEVADAGHDFRRLTPEGIARATASYAFPADVPADGALTYRFAFRDRDVIEDVRGYGGVWLTRNDALIEAGPLGPTGPGGPIETNDAFVYRTPRVRFIDPLVPLLESGAAIDVAGLSPSRPQRLSAHVRALLAAVFELGAGRSGTMQLSCAHAYPIAGEAADLWVTTPIRLLPSTPVDAAGAAAIAGEIAATLLGWRSTQDAVRSDARFVFAVTAFAPAGGSDGDDKPILRLTDLYLRFADIDWSAPERTTDG